MVNKTIKDLQGFIKYKARSESVVGGHWSLNSDDLESEAYLLVIGLKDRYKTKDYDEFLKICRTSIVNHFKELKGRYLKSNRKNDHYALSFEDAPDGICISDMVGFIENSPYHVSDLCSDHMYTSSQDPFRSFDLNLTDYDRVILDCLLGRNSRVPAYLHLVMLRAAFTGSQKPIRINEYIISRALCSSRAEVREGLIRIRQVIERITNG